MYNFHHINQRVILTYALLIGLTPLIPIPFLDDIVKNEFQRRMIRNIAAARGQQPTPAQIETLMEEDFLRGCIGGCFYALLYYPLKELLSKLFFFVEWRRTFTLASSTYYTGFLLDAAMMEGYRMDDPRENTAQAKHLRIAIEQTRANANINLITRLVRENLRPTLLLRAAWQLIRATVPRFPALVRAFPGAVWQAIRSAPGSFFHGFFSIPRNIRRNFVLRVQVLLGRERAPELVLLERVIQNIQTALLAMPTDHFDELRGALIARLGMQDNRQAGTQAPRQLGSQAAAQAEPGDKSAGAQDTSALGKDRP